MEVGLNLVNGDNEMQLTLQDLKDLAQGAAFLGSGGGGDPYLGRLMVKQALAEGGVVNLISPAEVPDDALVIPTSLMGSPTILMEKLPRGDELVRSFQQLEAHLGRPAFATMPVECAGINSMMSLVVGAKLGLPVIDADGMGRAFPELQMETFHVHGVSGTPMVITNEYGDSVLITTHDNRMMEWLARGTTIRMGGVSYMAEYPMAGRTVKQAAIQGTLSLQMAIGRCLRLAQTEERDPFQALIDLLRDTAYSVGVVIFEGKVIDVLRRTTAGFAQGQALIEAASDPRVQMELIFQNEYLLARSGGLLRAIVPDLICVLDSRTVEPIATEAIRYGQQVKVMAVSAPAMLRSPAALAVMGPQAFGLKEAFQPVEQLG